MEESGAPSNPSIDGRTDGRLAIFTFTTMANSAKYHGRRSTRTMNMKNSLYLVIAIIASSFVSPWVVDSFAPPPSRRISTVGITPSSSSSSSSHHVINADTTPSAKSGQQPTLLLAALNDESSFSSDLDFVSNDDDAAALRQPLPTRTTSTRRSKFLSAIRHKTKPITLAILTAASTTFLPRGGSHPFAIQPAKASAPIVLRAAQKKDDPPMIQALKKAEEIKKQRSLEEFDAFMAQANDIELSQGKSARAEYEKQYQLQKSQREAQKSRDVVLLKRQLLDAGQDPHTDIDAERQVFLLEHNVDLEKISGTPQNERMIKNFQKRRGKKSGDTEIEELKYQRYIIACQVADLKARGIDPMEYFANVDNMQKTRSIYKMEDGVAERVAKQYESLMKEYGGRLTPKKEGEVPFVYPEIAVDGDGAASAGKGSASSDNQDKAAAKAKRLAEKEALRQERADAKAKAKEERTLAAANAKAERAAAKEQKLAEKAATKAASAAAAAGSMVAVSTAEAVSTSAISVAEDAVLDVETVQSESVAVALDTHPTKSTTTTDAVKSTLSTIQSKATVKNIGTIVVGGGVATYAYNYFQENNAGAQKERERQLKLILGKDDDDEDDEEFDDDDDEDG